MPIGTAVHERTFALCESLNYREWSGYYAVSAYEGHHEHEYNAIRNASALIDVSPLFKYMVTGRDAARFVDRIITRDVTKMAVGQVFYTPWCDEHGRVIDDGTVARLGEHAFRWTAADPSLRWFRQNAAGLDVVVEEVSEEIAALALQGPTSAGLLRAAASANIEALKYFRLTTGTIAGVKVDISRTGYTGDLGYEIWMPAQDAVRVWDGLMEHGKPFDIKAAGMLALDVARISPRELQQLLVGEDLVGVADEGGEHPKLQRRERKLVLTDSDGPLREIDGDEAVVVRHRRIGVAALPAKVCLDPGEKLLAPEWVGDVVVRSASEASNLGQLPRLRGEHYDRYVAQLPDPLKRPPAVEPWHRDVENDEIRLRGEKDS